MVVHVGKVEAQARERREKEILRATYTRKGVRYEKKY